MRRRTARGHHRLLISVAIGAVAGAVTLTFAPVIVAVLVMMATLATMFSAWSLAKLWGLSADETKTEAESEDNRPVLEEILVVGAALAALGAIVVGMVMHTAQGEQIMLSVLGLIAIFASWSSLHVMYASRYAHMYYAGDDHGLDFNDDEPPKFSDFFYLAFTVGATFAVSDTIVKSSEIRSVIVRHGIFSFVFSTGILAFTLNLVTTLLAG